MRQIQKIAVYPCGESGSCLWRQRHLWHWRYAGRRLANPARPANRLALENAGIPGDTAEAGKRRFASLLELHKPTLVIIEIGGNDFLRRRAPKAVKEDLRSMIHAARQQGAQVVLIAVPELFPLGALTRAPADSPIYEELGDEENIPVIGQVFFFGNPQPPRTLRRPDPPERQGLVSTWLSGFYKALVKIGLAKTTS